MPKILLVDCGNTTLTRETMGIVEAVFEEKQFDTNQIDYVHSPNVPKCTGYDLIVTFGADALKEFCDTKKPIDDYAGSLTYNKQLQTWVLPTHHPNRIYGGFFGEFDIIYAHLGRAVDLLGGTLSWPPVEGHRIDWEFIGHNGEGWDPRTSDDRKIWTGYFEATETEVARAYSILNSWINRLNVDKGEQYFSVDTESFNTDHFQPMTMIQVYDPWQDKAYAFTWGVIEETFRLWCRFLTHPNVRLGFHNGKHDWKMIRHHLGIDMGHFDDTMCWAMGLTEKWNQTGLKYNARQYCNAPFWDENLELWTGSDRKNKNFGHIRPDILAEYGCADVFWQYQLSNILPKLSQRDGTEKLVRDILLPAQRVFAEIEYAGIRVDQDYADALAEKWIPKIESSIVEVQDFAANAGFPSDPKYTRNQILRKICRCVPLQLRGALDGVRVATYRKTLREMHGFDDECADCNRRRYVRTVDNTINVRSNPQMQHLCFDILDMEQTWEGRKTNKYFWEINQSHPFAKLVAEYREIDYLNRNIIQGFRRFIREDGRIHPDILLFGTTTGRLAIHSPSLQNVPARSDTGKTVKKILKPDEDHYCVNVDYSNLEIYMAHHLTGDEVLLEAVQKDMHRTTAAAMYMKAVEEVTAEERTSAKPVNFGAGYNIKAKKLSRDKNLIDITGGETSKAQRFLDEFWGLYRVWDGKRKEWIREALTNCEMQTELGRKRRWSLIVPANQWKVENQATNFLGQSMASDLCLTSLIQLHWLLSEKNWGRVMLSVHDSIVFSIHRDHIHEAVELIKNVMTTPIFETTTPFKVDVTLGPSYGEQYDYDPEHDYATVAV